MFAPGGWRGLSPLRDCEAHGTPAGGCSLQKVVVVYVEPFVGFSV